MVECLNYVKNDLLSPAFCYARKIMGLKELTIFRIKSVLTLPSLANRYFNSLKDENDEPIFTYTDHFMRTFERNSTKSGRFNAFKQYKKTRSFDEVFNSISK